MPNELWDKIDALAKEATEEHGETKVGFILTQVAEIGRTYKARGVKQLYDAVNFHCAALLSDSLGVLTRGKKKPR